MDRDRVIQKIRELETEIKKKRDSYDVDEIYFDELHFLQGKLEAYKEILKELQDFPWKQMAFQGLWSQAVRDGEDSPSGYYMVDYGGYSGWGAPKGSVHYGLLVQSWIHPSQYHELTYKEVMKYYGIWPLEN